MLASPLTGHGTTVTLNDVSFYVPPESISVIPSAAEQLINASSVGDLVPVTIVEASGSDYDIVALESTIADYLVKDDIFNEGFLQGEIRCFLPFSAAITYFISNVQIFHKTWLSIDTSMLLRGIETNTNSQSSTSRISQQTFLELSPM